MEEFATGTLTFNDLEIGDMFYTTNVIEMNILYTKTGETSAESDGTNLDNAFHPYEVVLFAGRKE